MSTQVQWRRGTTAQHATFTGAIAEVTVDTDKKTVVVHDGSTPGGSPLATEAKTTEKTSSTGSSKLPIGTTAQRDVAPTDGYIRYNSTLMRYEGYGNGAWGQLGGGAIGPGASQLFYTNQRTLSENYTLTQSGHMTGPLTIDTGAALTIATGERLVIL